MATNQYLILNRLILHDRESTQKKKSDKSQVVSYRDILLILDELVTEAPCYLPSARLFLGPEAFRRVANGPGHCARGTIDPSHTPIHVYSRRAFIAITLEYTWVNYLSTPS